MGNFINKIVKATLMLGLTYLLIITFFVGEVVELVSTKKVEGGWSYVSVPFKSLSKVEYEWISPKDKRIRVIGSISESHFRFQSSFQCPADVPYILMKPAILEFSDGTKIKLYHRHASDIFAYADQVQVLSGAFIQDGVDIQKLVIKKLKSNDMLYIHMPGVPLETAPKDGKMVEVCKYTFKVNLKGSAKTFAMFDADQAKHAREKIEERDDYLKRRTENQNMQAEYFEQHQN